MTTTTKTRKIPAPLFAAAGAGDLAYQRLRKLPEQVSQLRDRVSEIAPTVSGAVSETNLRVDIDRLRDAARRNAANLLAGAQQASERAAAVYSELVVRGERVVRNVRTTEAAIEVAPAAGTVTATTSQTSPVAKKAVAKKATASKAADAE
jgi:heparin binding hemagglutinin HbhA